MHWKRFRKTLAASKPEWYLLTVLRSTRLSSNRCSACCTLCDLWEARQNRECTERGVPSNLSSVEPSEVEASEAPKPVQSQIQRSYRSPEIEWPSFSEEDGLEDITLSSPGKPVHKEEHVVKVPAQSKWPCEKLFSMKRCESAPLLTPRSELHFDDLLNSFKNKSKDDSHSLVSTVKADPVTQLTRPEVSQPASISIPVYGQHRRVPKQLQKSPSLTVIPKTSTQAPSLVAAKQIPAQSSVSRGSVGICSSPSLAAAKSPHVGYRSLGRASPAPQHFTYTQPESYGNSFAVRSQSPGLGPSLRSSTSTSTLPLAGDAKGSAMSSPIPSPISHVSCSSYAAAPVGPPHSIVRPQSSALHAPGSFYIPPVRRQMQGVLRAPPIYALQ